MKKILCAERPDWKQTAESLGFMFHTIDDEPYWDESAYYQFSLRQIDHALRDPEPAREQPDEARVYASDVGSVARTGKSGVLVVGVDSLLTQLSRCCKPAPPDVIGGFVTRGKGVSIHRLDCSNFRELASRNGERVIDVRWGERKGADGPVYPVNPAGGHVASVRAYRSVLDIPDAVTWETRYSAGPTGPVPTSVMVASPQRSRMSLEALAQLNIDSKQSVRVATTANIALTGLQSIDGLALAAGDRVLVKNQLQVSKYLLNTQV